ADAISEGAIPVAEKQTDAAVGTLNEIRNAVAGEVAGRQNGRTKRWDVPGIAEGAVAVAQQYRQVPEVVGHDEVLIAAACEISDGHGRRIASEVKTSRGNEAEEVANF